MVCVWQSALVQRDSDADFRTGLRAAEGGLRVRALTNILGDGILGQS